MEIDLGPAGRRSSATSCASGSRRTGPTTSTTDVDARPLMYAGRSRGQRRGPTSCTRPATCASRWPKEYGGRGPDRHRGRGAERGVRPRRRAPRDPRHGRVAGRARRSSCTAPTSRRPTSCPRIIDGTDRYCQGFSEPDAGSDLAGLKTRGVVDGDEVVITGQKVWTSGAQMANMMFCLCRTDPDAPKHRASPTCSCR